MTSNHSFEGPVQGYLVNQMQANLWRFDGLEDGDVLQEGYEIYVRCADRYPDVEPRHFMALYKSALHNRFTDLANEATKHRHQNLDDYVHTTTIGSLENDGYLRTVIRQAPAEVKMVLNLFLNAPTELLELAMTSWRAQGRIKAGGNAQVAQWLGLPAGSKPLDVVRDYFEADL